MNTISKIHQLFSEYLENPRVLENPEEFLGPNYKEVLNYWLILDDLSEEQLRVVKERYEAFYNENRSEWCKAALVNCNASDETIGTYFTHEAGKATYYVGGNDSTYLATHELIGMRLLFERNNSLTFFNMFLEVL